MFTKTFFTDDFESRRLAEKWCADHGFSVGRCQAGAPRGLLYGDFDIQKWRNLSMADRLALHGSMQGSMRNGPVTIRVVISVAERAGLARSEGTPCESF